ncbi:MAG: DUF11 domain-containing protein [Euryarchaeota archaeon]|nr:DUF11 domain-containing protein [Euryarchaeota archaeon]MBU4453825.1 DUF11 domain-containing protein [Euryarchaeota archaeon]MCG2738304.1 DUF11 domain-containing protein [Candidatus Methanoperedenaceae archaeon]
MKPYILLAAIAVILISTQFALADDCEYIKGKKICWDDGTVTTLSWGYSRTTISGYQIEARDFNWLGSVFIRVTYNNTVKEGMLSQGEAYIFDFSNSTGFLGVKIIADEVSNINPMPANIGIYPNDPGAKLTVKFPKEEEKKIPELSVSISTDGETKAGSIITTEINLENSGKSDIVDTGISIYYDGLKLLNEYDAVGGYFSEGTLAVPDIQWENTSKYSLSRTANTIVKDGFFIEILNFSDSAISLSAAYNLSVKSETLVEGGSMIFNFTTGENYAGFRLLGGNFSTGSAELTMQRPLKNVLRRSYSTIAYGNSKTIKLSFKIPVSPRKSFAIRINAGGKDYSGNIYNAKDQETISTSDTLRITKRVSDSILGERIYPEYYYGVGGIRSKKDVTYVNIRVENVQSYPVHGVKLVDTVTPGFNFVNDTNSTSISWDFDINASDFRDFRYELRARRMGVYNLPKAELYWNEWGDNVHIESDSPKTTVSGPYLGVDRSLNKSSLNVGEPVQVTLLIINNGDVPTNVTVREKVPINATFLSGSLSFSGFLNPGETARVTYNLSASNDLDFKPPEISSRNTGFEWYAPLPQKKIIVMKTAASVEPVTLSSPEAKEAPVPSEEKKGLMEIINERLPWLEGAVSMLSLMFAILILLKLNKIKRTL